MNRAQKLLVTVSVGLIIAIILVTGFLLDQPTGDTGISFVAKDMPDQLKSESPDWGHGALFTAGDSVWFVPVAGGKTLDPINAGAVRLSSDENGPTPGFAQLFRKPDSPVMFGNGRAVAYSVSSYKAGGSSTTLAALRLADDKNIRLAETKGGFNLGRVVFRGSETKAAGIVDKTMDTPNVFMMFSARPGNPNQTSGELVLFDFSQGRARRLEINNLTGGMTPAEVLMWTGKDIYVAVQDQRSPVGEGKMAIVRVNETTGKSENVADLGSQPVISKMFSDGAIPFSLSKNGRYLAAYVAGELTVFDLKTEQHNAVTLQDPENPKLTLKIARTTPVWSADGAALIISRTESSMVKETGVNMITKKVYAYSPDTKGTVNIVSISGSAKEGDLPSEVLSWSRDDSLVFATFSTGTALAGAAPVKEIGAGLIVVSTKDGSKVEVLRPSGMISLIDWQ